MAPADQTAGQAVDAPAGAVAAAYSQSDADADQRDIIVTGTSIRGAAPVGSSLISVGRADIEASAATTTIRLLQETPQVLNYGVSDSSRNGTGGATNISYGNSINLRGVGPYATLTLLNGRRVVPQGTTGATIDPSSIPTIALERVEIVADGSSAIYGSDAVAGVANLILRRNFQGFQVEAQKSFADSYGEFQLGAIAGHKWDSGQITLAFQHAFRSNLSGFDREFYRSDLRAEGGADYRVSQCYPGNIVVGGASYAIPAGGATPTNLVRGTQNLCDNVKATDILPRQEINSGTLTFNQDITNGIRMFVDGYAARRDGFRLSAVAAQNLTVPRTNAFYVAPAGNTATSETVQYSFVNDYGPHGANSIKSVSWQASAGLEIDLPRDFQLTAYGTAGHNSEDVLSFRGQTNTAALTSALASSNPATAFNPFGTSVNNPTVIAAIFDQQTATVGRVRLRAAAAKIDGALFSLPGGEVRVALGADYYQLHLRTGQLRGPAGGLTGTIQVLERDVKSAYGELLVPIFGPDNAIPGFYRLDLDVAGRIDRYSDVGTTRNPKIGINWSPVEQIKLHGSYGTSFRAPLLTNVAVSGTPQIFIQNYFDPTANGGAGGIVQGAAQSGANPSLRPETARTYSFGVDYSPSVLPGAQLSVNYFDLVYEKQIVGFLSNLNVLRQESLFSSIILRGAAAQARIRDLIAAGAPVNGGTAAVAQGLNVYVDGRSNNLGVTITRGLDVSMVVPARTEQYGDFRFALRGTRYFVYKVALTPTAPTIDQVNNIDYPLRLRLRGSVGWNLDGINATAFFNYQNGYRNTLVTPSKPIARYATMDLNIGYIFGDGYDDGRRGLRLALEINNLFDRDPPFVDIAPTNNGGGGFDPQTASPIGRLIAVSLSKKF